MDPSLVIPAVPVVGISPTVQWLMGMASVIVAACLPILLAFLRTKFNADAVMNNNTMIRGAIDNGVKLGIKQGTSPTEVAAIAVNYAHNAVPDAIAATPQATDAHLTNIAIAQLPPALKG